MNKLKRSEHGFHVVELLLVLAVIASIGLIGRYVYEKNTARNTGSRQTLASAKPQFSSGDSAAGYLTYNANKFKEVQNVGLPEIKSANPDINTVIVAANVVSYGDSGLYLYDLKANKTYKLTSGGGDPRIMSDHFVMYGTEEGDGAHKKLQARLLDLSTGKDRIIFSSSAEKVAGTVCCSVSPDGFQLAWAQKNKISIWDIRSDSTKDYSVTLNPVDKGSTSGSAGVEMNYATPVWADNDTVIYADKPATKTVIVDGASTKPAVDTDLFTLNLADGKSSQRTTNASGIYDIYAREGGSILFTNEVTVGSEVNQFSKLSLDTIPEVLATTLDFASLSPKGDKLYIFPSLYNPDGYNVVDTNTKESSLFNPLPSEITQVSQIIPKGWAGEDNIILEILDTSGSTNHEYIAIYKTTINKVEQYTKIN